MRANGWQGDAIDVVRMPDGKLTTLDNTRVLAADQAGIQVFKPSIRIQLFMIKPAKPGAGQ